MLWFAGKKYRNENVSVMLSFVFENSKGKRQNDLYDQKRNQRWVLGIENGYTGSKLGIGIMSMRIACKLSTSEVVLIGFSVRREY